jgi:hypothetical protein
MTRKKDFASANAVLRRARVVFTKTLVIILSSFLSKNGGVHKTSYDNFTIILKQQQ